MKTLIPVPPAPGQVERYDYQYVRNGTVTNVCTPVKQHFMFCQPLGNWRRVSVRERKTCLDFAEEVSHLLDVDFTGKKVRMIEKLIIKNA